MEKAIQMSMGQEVKLSQLASKILTLAEYEQLAKVYIEVLPNLLFNLTDTCLVSRRQALKIIGKFSKT